MPDRSAFTLDTSVDGAGAVITLRGDLDLTTSAALAHALAELGETPSHRLVLDMAGVECLDIAAARVIATTARAWPGPRPVVIRDPTPIVRRLLQISGLDTDLRLEQTAPIPRPAMTHHPTVSRPTRSSAHASSPPCCTPRWPTCTGPAS